MALDLTPWMIGGGAVHSVEVARLLAYAATSGAEGVVEPASLAVKAQSTPNGTVAVRPGAALILNRYAGGSQQTYVLRNPSSTSVTIPATGSTGGRTDAIIAQVLDPQYEGAAPADPVTFNYARLERIASVPGNLNSIEQLGLSYPAILLAKITIPASTGTITNAMITDLRDVALPRTRDVWRPRPNVVADKETLKAAGTDGEYFPNAGGEQTIPIPKWATRVQIRATWMGVRLEPGTNWGEIWAEFGPYLRPSTRRHSTQRYTWDGSSAGGVSRQPWIVEDDVYIPADIRGTDQIFVMKARYGSAGGAWTVSMDGMSGVSLSLRFLEAADPSTT
ncbi:hypothetical protein [Arthrobacter sp. YC-RL1]|uniref:hypothetical protein n=1 Tax=Arthrobacter sp. YC-RL1 TaxID=1652545 RepID=UPI000AD42F93|nr:hypothetical protein [Arthrobacter sp. YC-RL1]